MNKIILHPIVSIILHILMFYYIWTYYSLISIAIYSIFIVFYSGKRSKYKRDKNEKEITKEDT